MTTLPTFLSPAMLEWLATRPRTMLTVDVVRQFTEQFDLEARQAGRLLGQWARMLP